MTSLAFGAGVIPLVFAQGAGAVSRQEIGISILGGVMFGTVLVLFLFRSCTYYYVHCLNRKLQLKSKQFKTGIKSSILRLTFLLIFDFDASRKINTAAGYRTRTGSCQVRNHDG